jgi:hypothetical protein
VTNCAITRQRDAPSAVRTATSRRRPVARANCRLATLTQAMSSTKMTEQSSMMEYCWVSESTMKRRAGQAM